MADYVIRPEDNAHSLIEADQAQLRLFSSAEMEGALFADSEKRGTFTGERLFAQDPERYAQIVSLLTEGLGIRQIARLCRVSSSTVMAVRQREPKVIETERAMLVGRMRGATRLMVDRVIDVLESADFEVRTPADLQRLLVSAGILIDKSELLSGGATSRVERVERGPAVGTLDDLWDSLPEAIDAEATDVPADAQTTGLPGQKPAPKALPDGPDAGLAAGDPDGAETATGDILSPDCDH